MLRELLHNCMAHSNYQLGGRIYVNEFEDSITITNPGVFLPQKIEYVLQSSYSPPYYRNALLVDAMVRFHMIETASSGIRRVFRIQKAKYFPMPDYDLSTDNQVTVTIYGKILNEAYTQLLYCNSDDLDLETVFLLDQVQKHNIISKEQAAALRKKGLIEGRYPNVFVSLKVASMVGQKADYVHNRGLDENICKQLIIQTLKTGPATQQELLEILDRGALPAFLTTQQKSKRVSNMLQKMRVAGLVYVEGSRRYSKWHLA
jgi:ATP-dependent DNA helicase RecG